MSVITIHMTLSSWRSWLVLETENIRLCLVTIVTFLHQSWATWTQFCHQLYRVCVKTVFSLLMFGSALYFVFWLAKLCRQTDRQRLYQCDAVKHISSLTKWQDTICTCLAWYDHVRCWCSPDHTRQSVQYVRHSVNQNALYSPNPRHAVLLLTLTLTLTFDLSTKKTIRFVGYPKVILYTKFEHFGVIRVDLCCGVWKCTYWPCDLDLWPPQTVSLPGYPKIILCTKFDHFGVIRFWVTLLRLTDGRTDSKILPTPTDILTAFLRFFRFFCLFVRSVTQKRMIPKCSSFTCGITSGYPPSGMVLGLKVNGRQCLLAANDDR